MISQFDASYPPARGPVLLLSCMDLRLLDEVTKFMAHDGLVNRYDHVIMAGAALGALGANLADYGHWRKTFQDHLEVAYKLHRIKDVYILEHRDCGAYVEFLGDTGKFSDEQQELESKTHCQYAEQLASEILQWAGDNGAVISVKAFLMDLRGKISLLSECKHVNRGRRGVSKVASKQSFKSKA